MNPAGDPQLQRFSSVAGNVFRQATHYDQVSPRHLDQGVPKAFQQQTDSLIVLQVSHVHRDRRLAIQSRGEDTLGAVAIPEVGLVAPKIRLV